MKFSDEMFTARFAMASFAMVIFGAALIWNPSDQTLVGAIIGGFNLALGYYLGSSSPKNNEPVKAQIVNPPDEPVPVENNNANK